MGSETRKESPVAIPQLSDNARNEAIKERLKEVIKYRK